MRVLKELNSSGIQNLFEDFEYSLCPPPVYPPYLNASLNVEIVQSLIVQHDSLHSEKGKKGQQYESVLLLVIYWMALDISLHY